MPNNKGGRPRLPEEEKKKHKLSVLLTGNEWKAFEENYKASGYRSQNKFVISRTASPSDTPALSPNELDAISELRLGLSEMLDQQRRIGNNFNQLMHLAQSEKELPQARELAEVEAGFRALEKRGDVYSELINALKEKWSLK